MLKNVAGGFAWKGKRINGFGTPLRVVRAVAVVTAAALSFPPVPRPSFFLSLSQFSPGCPLFGDYPFHRAVFGPRCASPGSSLGVLDPPFGDSSLVTRQWGKVVPYRMSGGD